MMTLREFVESLRRGRRISPPRPEDVLRRDERQTAVLAGAHPPESMEVERNSEYRLASLLQYPHY
jgi:Trk K+ transport system NAD-binding subunit